ncbi:hypothetical protein FQN60_000671, partial [Etheostoma spectabile]
MDTGSQDVCLLKSTLHCTMQTGYWSCYDCNKVSKQ